MPNNRISIYAAPGVFGPWYTSGALIVGANNSVNFTLGLTTRTDPAFPYTVEIEYFNGEYFVTESYFNTTDQSVSVSVGGGDDGSISSVKVRLKSFGPGQNITADPGSGVNLLPGRPPEPDIDVLGPNGEYIPEEVIPNPIVPIPTVKPPIPDWFPDAQEPIFGLPGFSPSWLSVLPGGDPLILDLDGDGKIELTSLENGVHFDFLGTDYARKMGWVAPDDGLLTIDLDGNGTIDNMNELFGSGFSLDFITDDNFAAFRDTENGFAKLAAYDSNNDGMISALDDVWNELRVWQDVNQDGVSNEGELLTLDSIGIAYFDVKNYEFDNFRGLSQGGFTRVIEGNTITHHSTFTMVDGSSREIVDAWLNMDAQNTVYQGDYTLDVRALFLPTLRGYGMLPDLHVAMSIDNGPSGLLEQVQNFATARDFGALFHDFDTVRAEVRDIMLNWAGIDEAALLQDRDYSDHGLFGSMPEYMFLRKLAGLDDRFDPTWFDQSPWLPRVQDGFAAVREAFDNMLDGFTARMVFQVGGDALFENGVSYTPFTDVFEGSIALSQTALTQLEAEATGHGDVEVFWRGVARYLDGVKGLSNLSAEETGWLESAVDGSSGGTSSWAGVLDSFEVSEFSAPSDGGTVTGTRWNDVINGSTGDDTLVGGDGDDVLDARIGFGDGDTNIMDGGAGNDMYHLSWGNDVIRYSYGDDLIIQNGNVSFHSHDIIEFDDGITPEDVSVHLSRINAAAQAQHLVLEVAGRGSIMIEINGYPVHNGKVIDELHFADGSVQILEEMRFNVHGTNDDDSNITPNNFSNIAPVNIYGYDGDDTINLNQSGGFADGGLGNDLINGSTGDDTLFLSGGTNQFRVGGGNNKILLPEGYTLDDVSFYRYADLNNHNSYSHNPVDALITVNGLGSVSIIRQFNSESDRVQTLEFFDGSTVDLLTQEYFVLGTDGDDDIHINGNWTTDNTVWTFGTGHDVIHERYGIDTILFSEGITFSNLAIYKQDLDNSFTERNHLVIEDGQGNSLTVHRQFDNSPQNYHPIEILKFNDGSIVNIDDLEIEVRGNEDDNTLSGIENGDLSNDDVMHGYGGDDTINGLSGADDIYAGSGDDTVHGGDHDDLIYGESGHDKLYGNDGKDNIWGGSGNDYLDGDYGADTLSGGSGTDEILGGHDNDLLIYNVAQNNGFYDSYNGEWGYDTLRINLTSGDYSVPFYDELQSFQTFMAQNYNEGSNSSASFDFQTIGLSASNIENLEIYVDGTLTAAAPTPAPYAPEARDDQFYGLQNQILNGNVLINNGFGVDFDFNGDVLSVAPATLTTALGGAVQVNGNGTFSYTPSIDFIGNDSFEYVLSDGNGGFDTGTVSININDVLINRVNGTAGNENIRGLSNEDNILNARQGDDDISGYTGNDTYIYNLGDGSDEITDTGGIDNIFFGEGITEDDLTFSKKGQDLLIYIKDEIITLKLHFWGGQTYQIETAEFVDGQTLDLTGPLILSGSAGDDGYLNGSDDVDDTLIGGKGDDDISGYTGNDTYIYNLGDGSDVITDDGGIDKILFGDGITPDDLSFTASGSKLLIKLDDQVITLNHHFSTHLTYQIETAEFTNGQTIDLTGTLPFSGTSESDNLYGLYDHDDILIGGKGDDNISGYTGNDTYIYNLGDGSDVITDDGGIDKILFGDGITPDDLRFSKDSQHFYIHIGVETIKLTSHVNYTSRFIETLEFADGQSIDLAGKLTFEGSALSESVSGTSNADRLIGGLGDDYLNGVDGVDTAVFAGEFENYTLTQFSSYLTVEDTVDAEGTDTLNDIERLEFADGVYVGGAFIEGAPINLAREEIIDFGGLNNVSDQHAIEDDGSTLHLSGNTWKSIDFDYEVTADTILEFDFRAGNQGEIHGIGLDINSAGSASRMFQLYGTQSNWGLSTGRNYDGSGDWQSYRIKVGDFYTGDMSRLGFINDHDVSSPTAESFFRHIKVYEQASSEIDFNGAIFSSYDTQDVHGLYDIADNGDTLELNRNTWKKIDFDYDVTDNTIVEFDFRVGSEGEIHGIGFENDNTLSANRLFQLAGTQSNWANSDFSYDGSGNWMHFAIDAGSYFTGQMSYLTFANDHDAGPSDAQGFFRNVNVHEADAGVRALDFTSETALDFGGLNNVSDAFAVQDGGDTFHLSGNTWKSIDFDYNVSANTVLEFDFRSDAQGEIHGIGFDINSAGSASRMFQLYGTQSGWGLSTGDDYDGNGDWQSYQINVGDFYTGAMSRLGFINDHDVGNPTAESTFRDVKVYERGSAGDDVLYGSEHDAFFVGLGGADRFVLDNDDLSSPDTISDFSVAQGDVLDLAALLDGYDPVQDAITDFVQITNDGADSLVAVDTNGGADNFTHIATLTNITGLSDETALENNGTLLAA